MSLIIIVPSRGRPHNVFELLRAWVNTVPLDGAQLLVSVDADDPTRPGYEEIVFPPGTALAIIEGLAPGMGPVLDHWAVYHAGTGEYDVVGFMGDDHRPRTEGWYQRLEQAAIGGVAYGNDGIQGPNLPTAVAIDARVVAALGYMVPPGMVHLYIDNFWLELGRALGHLRYLPDVRIEHLHPVKFPEREDERYAAVNSAERYRDDEAALRAHLYGPFAADVQRAREALQP